MRAEQQRVLIWGASGHALVLADILRLLGEYSVAGYIDSVRPQRRGESFGGATVVGGQEDLAALKSRGIDTIALGVGDCSARLQLAEIAVELGFNLLGAIHPSAIVAASARIGAGTVICAGAVVNPEASLGCGVIVNTCASVDHECVIHDGVHIAPGVHLAGNVTVGRGSFLGIGALVRDRMSIGERCVIGAGSVVVSDLPDGVTAYGVPARIAG